MEDGHLHSRVPAHKITAPMAFEGPMTGERCFWPISSSVWLQRCDATTLLVVMDNCRIHTVLGVCQIIEKAPDLRGRSQACDCGHDRSRLRCHQTENEAGASDEKLD